MFKINKAIIFGAANGLGREVSKNLIDQGSKVIIVDKDLKGLESLDDYGQEKGNKTTIVHLDVTETPKIFELADVVYKKFQQIDLLFSCSAILGELAPLNSYDSKIWARVIDVNLSSNAQIIKAFNPILQKEGLSQAIFTTCSIAQENKSYWGAYSVSKAGLENLIKIYASETEEDKVKVSLFDPVELPTRIMYQAMPNRDMNKITSLKKVSDFFIKNVTNNSFKHGDILKYS